jgi:hypothetical protein
MTPAHRRRTARGITLVEFVIVFPLAVLFVLSLIQAGFIYMAKLTLNHATFMAARTGAVHNARADAIKEALVRGLSPFYQDASKSNDSLRLGQARLTAGVDVLKPYTLTIDRLSPSTAAFKDFGVKDPVKKVTYIPNDNLEWRSLTLGATSKVHVRDANLLKIRAVYAYQLKVPLMAGVMSRVMCGGQAGVEAFGNVSLIDSVFGLSRPDLCLKYYQWGRIPIESVATVEMQSPAYQP